MTDSIVVKDGAASKVSIRWVDLYVGCGGTNVPYQLLCSWNDSFRYDDLG